MGRLSHGIPQSLDAKDQVPMARPRWIGTAMDVLSHDNFDVAKFIPTWLGSGHFLRECCFDNPAACRLRWWHPLELVLMVPHRKLFLHHDNVESWKHLGNELPSPIVYLP